MSRIFQPIAAQLEIINKLIVQAEAAVNNRPKVKGILVVGIRNHKTEWYLKQKGRPRCYLPKKEEQLARALVQAAYAENFLRVAGAVEKELMRLRAKGLQRSAAVMYQALAAPYEKLSEARRQLTAPYVLSEREFARKWEQIPYERKPFPADQPEIITERRERVRSKSEKMLADKLYSLGVPYRYEYPVFVRGFGTVYSDFTLLDVRERTELIYEHFGLMDDPVYCRSTLQKIDAYEKSGFSLGREFLCTFESRDHMLDMNHFEQMINERFRG